MTEVSRQGDTLTVTRTIDAPIDDVWDAWTNADKLKRWAGCADATTLDYTVDLRVGGAFTHAMQVQGQSCDYTGTYTTIDPPHTLAYTVPGGPIDPPMGELDHMPDTHTTVAFRARDDKTEVVLTVVGLPEMMGPIAHKGWTESFEQLAEDLA